MKAAIIASFTTLAAVVFAAPTGDHVRRSWKEPGHNVYEHPSHTFDPPAYNPSPEGYASADTTPSSYNPTSVSPPSYNPTGASPPPYYPTGVSPPHYNPTGVLPPPYKPTGVLPHYPDPSGSPPPSYPSSTGTSPPSSAPSGYSSDGPASCPVNGAVVCNGETQFGLCNWGHVIFMDVADGTACVDGKIVGTGIYAAQTPPSASAPTPSYN